jgi:hypothetical protein
MNRSDDELRVTLQRFAHFQMQPAYLRRVETRPTNFRLSAAGFLSEFDRMNPEVRECLSSHPSDVTATV